MIRQFSATVFALLAIPAVAGETAWQQVAPDARMRVVSSDTVQADGNVWIALDIALDDGTKTYWQLPGETGIPITVSVSGENGIALDHIAWPYPEREEIDGYLDYVYYGRFVLPVALTGVETGDAAAIEVRLGVCSDICVPVSARFDHRFELSAPDLAHDVRIGQARALVPLPWPDRAPPVARTIGFDSEAQSLRLAEIHPDIAPESVIAEIDGTTTLFDAPLRTAGGALQLALLDGDPAAIAGGTLKLTFLTDEGAWSVHHSLDAPDLLP